mgnify:CR=1 FL=1
MIYRYMKFNFISNGAEMKHKNNRQIDGRFWFTNNGEYFAGSGRIELLKYIRETGSISKAAKSMNMSYKAAWDSVDVMNKMTGKTLVMRVSGGKNGGGSILTAEGNSFVEKYEKYAKMFDSILNMIEENPDIDGIINNLELKSSADNMFYGKVLSISDGAVYSMVKIEVKDFELYASISKSSIEKMDLKAGDSVISLIKSNDLILSLDDDLTLSCRNQFKGTVNVVKKGAVNSEVYLNIADNFKLCVIVTNESVESMDIKYGKELLALCKASSVILVKRS